MKEILPNKNLVGLAQVNDWANRWWQEAFREMRKNIKPALKEAHNKFIEKHKNKID